MKKRLTFGSLFTGIGGFDLAFEQAGMRCAWQCDLYRPGESPIAVAAHEARLAAAGDNDKELRKVRDWQRLLNRYGQYLESVAARHWPDVERFNDVRREHDYRSVDVICGGFPCRDVSMAGLRQGLAGEQSGLWFDFVRVVARLRPRWVVVENVPGLLSSQDGRDFAAVLRGLAELGYLGAGRVFDSRYFGVPQRRRRVFLVAGLGHTGSVPVLFERQSGAGHPAAGRATRKEIAPPLGAGSSGRGGVRDDLDGSGYVVAGGVERSTAAALLAHPGRYDLESETFVTAIAFDLRGRKGGVQVESVGQTVSVRASSGGSGCSYVAAPLKASDDRRRNGGSRPIPGEFVVCAPPDAGGERTPARLPGGVEPAQWAELMPRELDSLRGRAMGMAVTVPVARWIGARIVAFERGMLDD
jgi:DNA (cytosine-5)-methyltransferase 1